MDWNLKANSWDLTEFVEEAVPSIDAVNGSSSYKVPRSKGDFSVDLKLGQVGNSGEESLNKWKEPGGLKMESSPSKRARATNNGTHQVSCLVDECNSDLSNCRDYHRRHKVCELHSKTAQVMINGQKQRFCQQCSRYFLYSGFAFLDYLNFVQEIYGALVNYDSDSLSELHISFFNGCFCFAGQYLCVPAAARNFGITYR